MSYIDGYDHELIGQLGYLPIYHPLEKIDGEGWGAYDFSATPENLVLGGGSGEHPGLVVHHLPMLVTRFLYAQLSDAEEATLSDGQKAFLDDIYYAGEALEFCCWSVADYARLQTMAESPTFMNPVTAEERVENWIEKSLGELVWYALPDLNPHHQALRIFSSVLIFTLRCAMSPLTPWATRRGGRIIENGRVKWGHCRWHGGTTERQN
ncbi:hypothetical protein CWS02_11960 [Enterobacter sp. EA-1]|nr:hypothetical protein CWS02_11960 [Enterobacter sp. EA-1]